MPWNWRQNRAMELRRKIRLQIKMQKANCTEEDEKEISRLPSWNRRFGAVQRIRSRS
jgi:hypothetical protein